MQSESWQPLSPREVAWSRTQCRHFDGRVRGISRVHYTISGFLRAYRYAETAKTATHVLSGGPRQPHRGKEAQALLLIPPVGRAGHLPQGHQAVLRDLRRNAEHVDRDRVAENIFGVSTKIVDAV